MHRRIWQWIYEKYMKKKCVIGNRALKQWNRRAEKYNYIKWRFVSLIRLNMWAYFPRFGSCNNIFAKHIHFRWFPDYPIEFFRFFFQNCLKEEERNQACLYMLGLCHISMGHFYEAIKAETKAIVYSNHPALKVSSEYIKAHYLRGKHVECWLNLNYCCAKYFIHQTHYLRYMSVNIYTYLWVMRPDF